MKNKAYLLAFLPIFLISCSSNQNPIESKIFGFGTYIEAKLFEGNKEDIKEIENIFNTYDKLSDNYRQRDVTNVYSINQTNSDIEVNPKLYDLLLSSFDVVDHGAVYFNPFCGSLSKKWKESLAKKEVLSEEVINEELNKMNNSSMEFTDNNIVIRHGEAEIDLGGIAKGYTLDKVKSYLDEKEIKQYLINAGSSSVLLGEKNTKDGLFSIGLKDVNNAYLKLKNCFVSTSSISEQGVTIDGVKYSHIINPVTGSAINTNDAVVVITDDGYLGDALSTSMMMNSVEEIKNIENEQNVKAIVINDGKITYKNNDIEVYYH